MVAIRAAELVYSDDVKRGVKTRRSWLVGLGVGPLSSHLFALQNMEARIQPDISEIITNATFAPRQ